MINVVPYLIFNGNCKEVMDFYNNHLNGDLFSMTYGQASQDGSCAEGDKDKIIHARISKGSFGLLASDATHQAAKIGDNVQLYLHCESKEEVDRLFKGLGVGGSVKVPTADTFWGAYFGMFVDKYGINWMLGYEYPKK